jgi:uncharacterized membrane protein YvbJ
MKDWIIFGVIIIGVIFLLKKLFSKKKNSTPNIVEDVAKDKFWDDVL